MTTSEPITTDANPLPSLADPNSLTPNELKVFLSSHEAEQDFYKHLATLSSGAIVIMGTFMEKLFVHPHASWLAEIAFAGFMVSIIGLVGMHIASVLHMDATTEAARRILFGKPRWIVIGCGLGGFLIGMLCLAFYGIANIK